MSKGVFVTQDQLKLTGSLNTATFLAQCLYWQQTDYVNNREDRPERNGWFYKSRDEWKAETWLSRYQQEKARLQLRSMGLLEENHVRLNTGIRIWFRFNLSLYYALLNMDPKAQTLTEHCKLTLDYGNEHWSFARDGLLERVGELYPMASQDVVSDAVDGHLEYWMLRCEGKQSPSLAQLRGMLLSREKDFFEFLDRVGQRGSQDTDQTAETENISDVLYERALSERSENNVNKDVCINETHTESKCVNNNKTLVLNTGLNESFKPENSTIVLNKNNIDSNKNSDIHCIDNNEVEIIEDVEVEESVEADASPLSDDLTDCSDKNAYRIDPQTYVFCHPFIYQFVRHCSVSGRDDVLRSLKRYGFDHSDVLGALERFVEVYGHGLGMYWRDAPVPVEPLTRADIDDAVRASLEV